jgi:hypothetical protein
MAEELKMYVEYRDGKPHGYLYGPSWKQTELYMEGGYPTEEEAKAAWELEEQRLHQEFCLNCCKKRNYHVSRRQVKVKVRDIEFTCPEYVAHCASCAKEIHVPTVHDMNCGLRERYYEDACSRNTPV